MLVKPGGTAYFQSFNFGNSRQVITAAQVNGQRLKHESNNCECSLSLNQTVGTK